MRATVFRCVFLFFLPAILLPYLLGGTVHAANDNAGSQQPAEVSAAETEDDTLSEAGPENLSAQTVNPTPAESPKFNIWQYEVEGITLLQPEAIQLALASYLGPDLDLDTVNKAAEALEVLYRDAGYPTVFVDVPEQNVVGGQVRLRVTEGVVSRVWVKDSDYFLLSDIKKRVPSLTPGQTLYIPAVQSELSALNTLSADLRVVPVLRPGRDPGTVEIDLKVNDSLPLHGSIEVNDYYSANTTETRLSANISYDNLWHKYHSFSLQAQTAPEETDEVRVFAGTYVLPVGGSSRLAFYLVDSDSEVATLGGNQSGNLLVLGDSSIFGSRYVRPLSSNPNFQHVLTLGLDYKDVEEEVLFPENPEDQGLRTPVSYGLWSAQYSATWRRPSSSTRFGVGTYFGLRGIGNGVDEFEDKRFKGEPNFFYLQTNFRRTDALPAGMSLVSRARLQFTRSSLISNEQLSLGGSGTIRGYLESQRLGDRGVHAGLEFYSPRFFKGVKSLTDFRVLAFVEGGELTILNPLPDQTDRFTLASAGLGLRFGGFGGLEFSLDWAYPLKDACDGACNESGDIEEGESRTVFQLRYAF